MGKNKIAEVDVKFNHTIDDMIAFQKIFINTIKMNQLSSQELYALSICEDILKILECAKNLGTHQNWELTLCCS